MKRWCIVIAVLALATIQLIWPPSLSPFNIKPDLLLVFAVSSVFYFNLGISVLLGVSAGLLKDAFLPSPAAVNALLFAAWIYLVFKLSSQVSTDNDYVRLVIILIVVLLDNTVMGLRILGMGSPVPAGIFLRNLIVGTIYTAAFSPLVLKLYRKITV